MPDRIRGRRAGDLACDPAGADIITGGAGSDRLFGEDGNDRFLARDGEFDVVGCGAGRDSVVADREDLIGRDCELLPSADQAGSEALRATRLRPLPPVRAGCGEA